MKIYAKVWNKQGIPETIAKLENFQEPTLKNRRELRNKLLIRFPNLQFFTLNT